MSTIFKRILLTFCAAFICVCGGVAIKASNQNKEAVHNVYYVVQYTDHVEAGAGEIFLRGGAGYALGDIGVAIGVYFDYSEAAAALSRVEKEYESAGLYTSRLEENQRGDAAIFSCLRVVEGWLKVLENGESQSIVKEGLRKVSDVLRYIAWESENLLADSFANKLEEIIAGTVLSSDLRYFLCSACDRMSSAESFYF